MTQTAFTIIFCIAHIYLGLTDLYIHAPGKFYIYSTHSVVEQNTFKNSFGIA